MRYIFAGNIADVIAPMDLTYNFDEILEMLTGDLKGSNGSKSIIKNMFTHAFN